MIKCFFLVSFDFAYHKKSWQILGSFSSCGSIFSVLLWKKEEKCLDYFPLSLSVVISVWNLVRWGQGGGGGGDWGSCWQVVMESVGWQEDTYSHLIFTLNEIAVRREWMQWWSVRRLDRCVYILLKLQLLEGVALTVRWKYLGSKKHCFIICT